MLFTGQVQHYPWYLSDSYLVKFHFRRLKCRMLMFITSSPREMGPDMSCLGEKLIPFKPSRSVAKYHRSNGELGRIGLLCSERARVGIWGDPRGKSQEAERH